MKTIITRRGMLLLAMAGIVSSRARAEIPKGYRRVWSDEFTSLSRRTGGPTDTGLQAGRGTWSSPGNWWGSDSKGIPGYAYDWLVDPSYSGWPDGYQGPFKITNEGLRIRSEPAPPDVANLLPQVRDTTPWLSAQINSWHAVRIAPPFYFECKAKMPAAVGRPWPAIWLMTGVQRKPDEHGKEYEIDLHEGFGDSDKLHSAIHWNPWTDKTEPVAKGVVETPIADLSKEFHIWGCHVTKERQTFFFDGKEVGSFDTPADALADQHFSIILDVSAGIPWKDGGPPSNGPHDMIVRYVRLYAPNANRLMLR